MLLNRGRPISGRFVLFGLFVVLGACSAPPTHILDSDVPTPPGLEGRLLENLKRDDGRLVEAHAMFVGHVANAEAALSEAATRFFAEGWTMESSEGDEIMADGLFLKDDRSVRVRVIKNELDPAMSRMSYVLVDTGG
jgi:hypothetical protein